MITYANPFDTWAELLRDLRKRLVAGIAERPSPFAGEILGNISGLVTACEKLARRIDNLERSDPETYAAFQRAIEGGCDGTTE